jgi:ABC-type Zn2+ transport system substrate-binding protein/surface adhesin
LPVRLARSTVELEHAVRKAMSGLAVMVMVAVLVATAPSLAWARSGHHGGKSHHGVSRHHGGGSRHHHHHRFHHHGFHHHRFHHHRGFVGSSILFAAPLYYPSYLYSPPVSIHEGYWYYCQSAGAYYPYVQTCSEPWIPVVPRAR